MQSTYARGETLSKLDRYASAIIAMRTVIHARGEKKEPKTIEQTAAAAARALYFGKLFMRKKYVGAERFNRISVGKILVFV